MTRKNSDADHVARYCSKMLRDTDGTPLPASFELRRDGECLSVNWPEYFGVADVLDNMVKVRKTFSGHYSIGKNGRFAVLNVGNVSRTVMETLGLALCVKDLQEDDYPSHACVDGYTADDGDVPIVLAETVGKDDMHPGVV